MKKKWAIVTGGCGFIGSNFIRFLLDERPSWEVFNIDALTYAANLANLKDAQDNFKYRFVKGDIADREFVSSFFASMPSAADYIINFAAETHVDRSILGPEEFIRTNINGTFNLIEAARKMPGCRYVQVSTDEVYGSLGDSGAFTEETPLAPNSPYSASKASADLLINAYHHTFGLDTVITRCSNNYGPYQFPEKLIPLMIINARRGEKLPVYGKGLNVRDWIHVSDHCRAILTAAENGRSGEVYNFGGGAERANIQIVELIADTVSRNRSLISFVKDRPGHDWRYAMDFTKAKEQLSWEPRIEFEEGLKDTVNWYLQNESWWQPILDGEYLNFYKQWYEDRNKEAKS